MKSRREILVRNKDLYSLKICKSIYEKLIISTSILVNSIEMFFEKMIFLYDNLSYRRISKYIIESIEVPSEDIGIKMK